MTPRVVEAERHRESPVVGVGQVERVGRTFFVASESEPGAWRRVDLVPDESLTCSCPFGLRLSRQPVTPQMRLCRHMRAVAERLLAERSTAVA